jgi:hypothetical protein
MSYAERNRLIKKVLTEAFKPHKVTVKGSRGTATGWVSIKIDYRPKDRDERDQLKAKVWQLFAAAKIEIGTYGYDDPGSDYGYGNKMHLDFGPCRDSFREGERVTWPAAVKTGTVAQINYRQPDWYFIQWDDAAPGQLQEFYKRDLVSLEAAQ